MKFYKVTSVINFPETEDLFTIFEKKLMFFPIIYEKLREI